LVFVLLLLVVVVNSKSDYRRKREGLEGRKLFQAISGTFSYQRCTIGMERQRKGETISVK
jgi:hypothetical protein